MTRNYKHLTYEKRCQIEALKKSGIRKNKIANIVEVHPSSIGRELKRNIGLRGYRHCQAQQNAKTRRQSRGPRKFKGEVLAYVERGLQKGWSPEQIAGRMKTEGLAVQVSHEWIYRHIWADKAKGGQLYTFLRRKAKKYCRRKHLNAGRGHIPNRVGIENRPQIVENKSRFGDFELDTVIGRHHKGALVTAVDRATKYTVIRQVENKTSELVSQVLMEGLQGFKGKLYTLTADNGKEFAGHQQVSSQLAASFYFARPYHSWERGLNEHTNGLIRQYFPKKTDLRRVKPEDVTKVQQLLNTRPRKVLGFKTPQERMQEILRQ